MGKSIPGVHSIKANPDRGQLKRWMDKGGVNQVQLAREIAKRTKTEFGEAQMSRRLSGRNKFSTQEIAAMAEIFDVPEADVLRAAGGIAGAPLTGTIDNDDRVIFTSSPRDSQQVIEFKTTNVLAGATLSVKMLPRNTRNVSRGIYLVQTPEGEIYLRQVLDRIGGKWITAPLFGTSKVEQIDDLIFVARALHLQFVQPA